LDHYILYSARLYGINQVLPGARSRSFSSFTYSGCGCLFRRYKFSQHFGL